MIVVGVGSSGALAEVQVQRAVVAVQQHPHLKFVARSALMVNPATGGQTHARFVNAAVVLNSALSLQALVLALHAIEHSCGRVRAHKDAARALDLDVLWSTSQRAPSAWPAVPHPRMQLRAFALVPAVEAMRRAGLVVPTAFEVALRGLPHSPARAFVH